MKMTLRLALLLLGLTSSLSAQIKIGDNPQNIDPSSVLELESSDRVLVITRVNTAQMNAIIPSEGALVYNTDEACVYYYNGIEWLNLCAGLGLDLTADAIFNTFPTIVLTENGPITNIEVGEIRGENIVDFSISAADIQNNSITSDKLAPNSVGVEELQDNTVADAEIDYNQVTLSDFINDVGYITGAQIISPTAGNDIIDSGGAFYDDEALQNGIATNAAAIAADGDTDATNELQDLTISSFTLGITGGNTVDLGVFYQSAVDVQFTPYLSINSINTQAAIQQLKDELDAVSGGGSDDQLLTLSGNSLSIEDGNSVDLSPFNNPGTDDQILTLTGNEIFIESGNSIDLTPILGGGGTDDQNLTAATLDASNILTIEIEDGASTSVDLSSLGGAGGTDDQNLTGATLDAANILTIDIEDGASTSVDLSSLAGGGGTIVSTDANNDVIAGTDGGAFYDDLDADPANEIELPVGGNNGQVLSTDGAGMYSWVDNAGAHTGTTGSIFFADDITGAPTENNSGFYWDAAFGGMTGALRVGIDGNTPSTRSKVHIMEQLPGNIAYALQIQNNTNTQTGHDDDGSTVGLLYAVEALGGFGKGALVFERTATFGRGDFHFLSNDQETATDPELSDAVVTITRTGNMGIGTTTPNEQLHVTGNVELEGDLIAQNGVGALGQVLTTTAAGTEWASPSGGLTGTPGSIFFADDPSGNPTENNAQLFWDNSDNKLYVGNQITTTSDVKLNVNGTTRSQGIKNSDGTSATPAYRFTDDLDTGIFRPAADELAVSTGNFEALRISTTRSTINGELELNQELIDTNDEAGTAGQILSSTGTGVDWVDPASPFHALGVHDGFGNTLENSVGVASVIKNAAGDYTVNFTNAANSANYVIQLSVTSPFPGTTIRAVNPTNNSFNVIIEDATQTLTDAFWYFTVIDF